MPRHVTNYQILCAIDRGLPLQVVADELGVSPRRVARIATGGRSAHKPDEPPAEPVGMRLKTGMHVATAPSPATAVYWNRLDPPQPPRPVRQTRMVPDDRAEELTFDDVLEATVAAFQAAGREGRGAA